MEHRALILVVDDSEMNRSLLADILDREYRVMEAANGVEAVSLLGRHSAEVALVLLDIVMPEMDGFEVLSVMEKSGWLERIPVITISAETNSTYIDRAYELGATDHIGRPFDERTVLRRVKNTVLLYAKQKNLEGIVTQQILDKQHSSHLMVEILSNIVEFRNGESREHVRHIRLLTQLLLKSLMRRAGRYGLTLSKVSLIANASALHDVGKISIPEEILNKPGKLTPQEFEVMKTHCAMGVQILDHAAGAHREELLRTAREICMWHHERYDGGGYPDGLKGDEIPISAQVVALADVYDALTSRRVYKRAYSHHTAVEMILRGECGAFNPELLECLRQVEDQLPGELERDGGDEGQSEAQGIASELMSSSELRASSRTLALLDQERIKYRFFASMSQEVQFEYNKYTDLLEMSDWGASYLGLPQLIAHPVQSQILTQVFREEDCRAFVAQLRKTTPEQPVVSGGYCLIIQGKQRWFKVHARTLWDGASQGSYTAVIGKFTDVHEEQTRLDNLRQLAEQDPLTGLYNHRTARMVIEDRLKAGDGRRYAMMLIDLDYFKQANDQFGHIFGDLVLQHIAQQMKSNIRQDDIAARVGGDEFLIFAQSREDAQAQVSRIFQALSGVYQQFPITVSMGVALYPEISGGYETLFHCADQALYLAKQQGRNRFCLYDKSIQGFSSVLSPMEH